MTEKKTKTPEELTYHEVQLVKSIGGAIIHAPDVKALFCAFMEGLVENPSPDELPENPSCPTPCRSPQP